MKNLHFKKILALSAHTDDMEFGSGASLHRFLNQGCEIYSAVFSICEESVPKEYSKDILQTEMYKSAEKLGIKGQNIIVYKYPVRKFLLYRQDILENMIGLLKNINPDLIFTHSTFDIHQDHQVISQESVRAFRYKTLLGYELPWNNISFSTDALIEVQKTNINAKAQALACYESQSFRHYSKEDFILSQAKIRGVQGKTEYAEAFEVIRLIM